MNDDYRASDEGFGINITSPVPFWSSINAHFIDLLIGFSIIVKSGYGGSRLFESFKNS
jgi:hypothetical protein